MTDRTILTTNPGMQGVGRRRRCRNTTRTMTALALGRTHGIVVHRHTRPARITVTRFTTVQAGMARCSGFIGRMTT